MALLSVKNKRRSLGVHVVQSPDTLSDEVIETLPPSIKRLVSKSSVESSETRMRRLKSQLTSTDYQVIKCYEYSLAGVELPYDINTLHSERESLREQIRTLETQISESVIEEESDG